jgi:hypothetical protein
MKKNREMTNWEIFWLRVRLSRWYRTITICCIPRFKRFIKWWEIRRWWGKTWVKILDHRCDRCSRWQFNNSDYILGMCMRCYRIHDASYGGGKRKGKNADEDLCGCDPDDDCESLL